MKSYLSSLAHSNSFRLFLVILILSVIRLLVPERSIESQGGRAWWDVIFVIAWLFFTIIVSWGLGRKALNLLNISGLTFLELSIFGCSLGFGLLGLSVLVLMFAGAANKYAYYLLLILSLFLARHEIDQIIASLKDAFDYVHHNWKRAEKWKRILSILGGLIFILCLIQALTPPTDPDGMIVHLQAPYLFLKAGRIFPSSEFTFANSPMIGEMIFSIGIAFGSDSYAKLIHLFFAVILTFGTFTLARRFISDQAGWIASAILIGIPIFPIWSTLAYVDMIWAVYELFAGYALLIWTQNGQSRWLVLAGLMAGFAMGTDYLGIAGSLTYGFLIVWYRRKSGFKSIIHDASLFGLTAILVSSPWFIKNLVWFGNPVFPYFSGDTTNSIATINPPRSSNLFLKFINLLLLPINLYAQREKFAGVYGTIELPSLLFPFIILLVFIKRTKIINLIAGIVLLRYLFWALLSSTRLRYLLSIFPYLCVMVAYVSLNLGTSVSREKIIKILRIGLIGGVVVSSLTYSILFFIDVAPIKVLSGLESKEQFLKRRVSDYSAKAYILHNIPKSSRVMMMWDSRGYYCDERCLPDYLHTQWTDLVMRSTSIQSLVALLKEKQVTYLLFSEEDLDYELQKDSSGIQKKAVVYFLNEFRPKCTNEIYKDDSVVLYKIVCP